MIVKCSDCGKILDDVNLSECPICTSKNRTIYKSITARAVAYENARLIAKRPGRRPFKEVIIGCEYFNTKNRWVRKKRIIDRETDEYEEVVADLVSGEIIHECKQQLSKHIGHGSDKFEKIYKEWKVGNITAERAAELLGMRRNTFYRRVAKYEAEKGL